VAINRIGRSAPLQDARPEEAKELGIPGARRSALFYQDRSRLPTVSHGRGIWIWDNEGRRYLDGCSGAVSANLGHGHERMIRAAREQLERIAFSYRTQFENEPANALAELLAQLTPPELTRVFFVNSGSEAVEAAMKLARQYWWSTGKQGKSMIVSRRPCYHGSTLGALSTTDYAPLNAPFRPLTIHTPKVAAPFCYHCPLGREYPECNMACAMELERVIRVEGAENVAAFICEAIGGASTGAAVPPDEYFPLVERICHDNDVLLIIDDVMAGCGRTGTFFGFEHWDITPDIVATSKGLSAGYTPLGAIIANEAVVEPVLESGGFLHGHTYAGNPLSCAIALEAVRVILDEHLVDNARQIGTYLFERLYELKNRYPIIGDVRGRGLLSAIEFVRDRSTREPFPASWYVAFEAAEIARERGLLIYPRRSLYGLSGDHVMIAPPLIVTPEEVDMLIDLLDATLADLTQMLDRYVAREAVIFDETIARYHQSADVPDYARGRLDEVEPISDANVTAAMETSGSGHDIDEEDWREPE
jgi:adenosylmethionine-8-amino-7-oxononanoate aminotransferase